MPHLYFMHFSSAQQRKKLEQWHQGKSDKAQVPPPRNKCMRVCYIMSLHPAFELVMQVAILINVVMIILETVERNNCRMEQYGNTFKVSNYVFIAIYIYEAAFKVS